MGGFLVILLGALSSIAPSPGSEVLSLQAVLDPRGLPLFAKASLLGMVHPWVWVQQTFLLALKTGLRPSWFHALFALRLPNLLATLAALMAAYGWMLLLSRNRIKALIALVLLMLTWGTVSTARMADLSAPAFALWMGLGASMTAMMQLANRPLSTGANRQALIPMIGLGLGILFGLAGVMGGWPLLLLAILSAIGLTVALQSSQTSHLADGNRTAILGFALLGAGLVLVAWLPVNPAVQLTVARWISWPPSFWEAVWSLRDLMPGLLFLPAAAHRFMTAQSGRRARRGNATSELAYSALLGWLIPATIGWVLLGLLGVAVNGFVVLSPWVLWASLYVSDILGGDYQLETRRWHAITLEGWVLISLFGLLGLAWLLFSDLPDRYLAGVAWSLPGPDAMALFFDKSLFLPVWKLWLLPGLILVLVGVLGVLVCSVMRLLNEALITQAVTTSVLIIWMLYGVLPMVNPATQPVLSKTLHYAVDYSPAAKSTVAVVMTQNPLLGLSAWIEPRFVAQWQREPFPALYKASVPMILVCPEKDYYALPFDVRRDFNVKQAFTQWRVSPWWQIILNRSGLIEQPRMLLRQETVILAQRSSLVLSSQEGQMP
ncbi:MAG: hypothetical protein VKK59_06265 [Vampirovibrionales bacterium]|nr:hypothetical protein [Vampirovibrionales bacterium]